MGRVPAQGRAPSLRGASAGSQADGGVEVEVAGLTTVRIHGYEIGRLAAEMILARLRGQSIAKPCLEVDFEIVGRDSTHGPAKRAD